MPTWMLFLGLAWGAPLEDILTDELDRAMETFASQPEAPHYAALAVETRDEVAITARAGALGRSTDDRTRTLDVDLRVGTPALDSTHQLRGMSGWESDDRGLVRLPVDDDAEYALRHIVWRELDARYRDAAERIVMIRANRNVKVEEESPADDFVPRDAGVVARSEVPPLALDRDHWEDVLTEVSARLDASPAVHDSRADLAARRIEKVFVDTEGARLVHGRHHLRVGLSVETTAPDGDRIHVFESYDVHDPGGLPDRDALLAKADWMVDRLEALREAPRGEPFSGPVILRGRAAAVFFHEVFGHRVEGHRQKDVHEGRTFADHVGRSILPPFIDVYDDPTLANLHGTDLNGHYAFDDEGTPARRAELVDDGVFVGFLMGRSPIAEASGTNGHGRRSPGRPPTARMGNTVVQASETVPDDVLVERLRALAREQGREYGVIVEEIDGGFTMTGRHTPNAFNVRASASWKVYADGRPSELVRGIDLVGTPFVAFSNLEAAGDETQVFNGTCGAESGWVPVSGVAPSLLFRRLEFQLKEKAQERPPLLVKPSSDSDGAAMLPAPSDEVSR